MSSVVLYLLMACGTAHASEATPEQYQCGEYYWACMDLHKSDVEPATIYCASQAKQLYPKAATQRK